MKSLFYYLVLVFLLSCQSKPNEEDLTSLNGYWEIERVRFPDGTQKDYQVNEWMDKIYLKGAKGWRQKVQPQVDGKFIQNDLKESLKIIDSNDCYYLKTKATYTSWTEKIVSVSKDVFTLENDAKIEYHYKRFVPYAKRK